MSLIRTRWAAIGAAVAITLGAGGIGLVRAANPGGALTFVPITPCRIVDTRPDFNIGPRNTPLTADYTMTVATRDAPGECQDSGTPRIPLGAAGISLNVTAVGATAPTFLTIFPSDQPRPTASSLNPVPGAPATPNAVVSDLSAGVKFDVYNLAGNVDVIVDINGYYIDHDHDDRYYTEAEIDTRTALTPFAGGFIQSNATIPLPDTQPTLGRNIGVESVIWNPAAAPNGRRYEIQLAGGINFSVQEFVTTVVANCPGADGSVLDGGAADTRMYVYIERVGSSDTLGQCGFSFTVARLPAG